MNYKLIAPTFFINKVSLSKYYTEAIELAIANGESQVFCHFEGDRHCQLPIELIQSVGFNELMLSEEELTALEITDQTVFE